MTMQIVDINGAHLAALAREVAELEARFRSDLVYKVAVAFDDLDGTFKLKINEGVWSLPMGRRREQ